MREPEALISTVQLADAIGRLDLRAYDCTTFLEPPPPGHDDPYIAVPGIRTFEEALYDASMGEWARDPSLPIETD